MPHPENIPQTKAYFSEADVIYFGGAAGGGKALASEEPVITPWGVKAIGDLRAGDTICNPDGSSQKVLYVYHQGIQDLYKVGFQDGVTVKCTADHLWMYAYGRTKATREWLHDEEYIDLDEGKHNWRIGTTSLLMQRFNSRTVFNPRVPLTNPINYQVTTRASKTWYERIDPYVLGALLGDGALSGPGIVLTVADEEIIRKVRERTKGQWTLYDSGKYGYHARGFIRHKLNLALKELGLKGKLSHEKFIPKAFLTAPVDARFELLQGLMDTDGYVSEGGKCEYCTTSRALARGVRILVWSLGGRANLRVKTNHTYYNSDYDEYRDAKDAYTVHIEMKDKQRIFSLARKVERADVPFQGGRATVKRRIDYIESIGQGEATCIAVDHPNGLFLTNGFVVTHNSDLLLGLAFTDHKKSIIFRREYKQLRELMDRSFDVLEGTPAKYSQTLARWSDIPGDRVLEFGAVQYEKDKENFKGRPHDFIGFDEVADFTESQFRFLMAWNRTTQPGQRCRVVCAGNPPMTPEGRWVTRYWAPWIQRDHPNRAMPGELRWFATIAGKDTELENGDPFMLEGEEIFPKSRTFFPAFLSDNPYFRGTGYLGQLQSLPEPLRSQLLLGDFFLEEEEQVRQVIPTAHIRAAMARWSDQDIRFNSAYTDVGLDPSRGGKDQTVLAPRTGTFFHRLVTYEGREIKDGNDCAAVVTELLGETFSGMLRVDIIGVGAGAFDVIAGSTDYQIIDVNFASASFATDRSGRLEMRNVRAEAYWRLREALDPETGDNISLPPDEELVEDLAAPLWTRTTSGILIESKDQLRKRLGRSPGRGDAVAISYLDTTPGVLFR